ncbi:MAG: hypothetical protein ACUVQP_03665 [Bacteroidales bacterium]
MKIKGNIKSLIPSGLNDLDFAMRKIVAQAQSKYHKVNEGAPNATAFTGEIQIDNTNKRLLVRMSDGWYYINLTKLN